MTRIARTAGRGRWAWLAATWVVLFAAGVGPAAAAAPTGDEVFQAAVDRWVDLFEPPDGAAARTLTARVKLTKTEGLVGEAAGAVGELAFQAPDRLRVSAVVAGQTYAVGRDGQRLWVHEPGKQFAVLGRSGLPRFKADPADIDRSTIPPFALPVSRLQLRMAMLLVKVRLLAPERVGETNCRVLELTLRPTATELLGIDAGTARLWLRPADLLPLRIAFTDGRRVNVEADVIDPQLAPPTPAETWRLAPNAGDKVETVPLVHLLNFLRVAPEMLQNHIPPLGPATGRRELVAKSGHGRLEKIDGARVLFLKGTPEEMGRQHGTLLRTEARDVCDRILYGVGVGSSFARGSWFFGEIEGAQARLEPHMDPRHLREMDALSRAAGLHPQEGRLSNFFPELFHCSGFALTGDATADGHVYHGRVLDYLRGVGLEQNAVVTVYQPDAGNAWVNVGYAGFVGSVTAMNEKGISIGEMGGRGYGAWDGKPMAELVREVMEQAGTLDEAVALMRRSPRTCEYYYVVADGPRKTAVGIAATPDKFEVLKPGEFDARLPHPIPGTLLLSAGDRYEELAKRVKAGYGRFDAPAARDLMTRPVCMTSNIHSVLFRPDTLDFWVANADSQTVASHARYTQYNLKQLLKSKAPEAGF